MDDSNTQLDSKFMLKTYKLRGILSRWCGIVVLTAKTVAPCILCLPPDVEGLMWNTEFHETLKGVFF